jgi:TolA-binding protein
MSAPATDPLKLGFSDGTRVSLWPRARGRITRLSPNGADLVVEQGRASFAVVHQARSHWQVSTGPFVVQVTGTRFDVEWQPEEDHFELSLFEGHVRVLGCGLGEGQDLNAGQRIEASCARKEYEVSAVAKEPTHASGATPSGDDASEGFAAPRAQGSELRSDLAQRASNRTSVSAASPPQAAAPAPANTPTRAQEVAPNWTALARAGRFADAYDAALSADFDAECLARGAPELLLLGDAARLSGHVDRARQAYLAVRRRWPGRAGAALAAFQIGRTEFDQRRAFGEAETWLRAYLREQPNGEFAAPAMGRLMEAEIRLNHYESARTIAKSYLDRYPRGAHGVAAQQLLDASPTSDH